MYPLRTYSAWGGWWGAGASCPAPAVRACSAQGAGTRGPYARYGGPGTRASTERRTQGTSCGPAACTCARVGARPRSVSGRVAGARRECGAGAGAHALFVRARVEDQHPRSLHPLPAQDLGRLSKHGAGACAHYPLRRDGARVSARRAARACVRARAGGECAHLELLTQAVARHLRRHRVARDRQLGLAPEALRPAVRQGSPCHRRIGRSPQEAQGQA